MPRVSFVFFAVAAVYALIGMVWGSEMGASGDHSTLAGHAHLNLLGFVTLSIMGAFYGLAAGRAPSGLAWANLLLSAAGAALMAVSMAELMVGNDRKFLPMVIAGDVCSMLGMLLFLIAVLLAWRARPKPALA